MTDWLRLIRKWSLWDAVSTAPRGAISRWVTLWTVLWATGWGSWVIWRVFGSNPPSIDASTAAALSAFLGTCVAGAWGFFRWARGDKITEREQ